MPERTNAIVVGVGAEVGVGGAVCHRLAREGLHVFVAGRTQAKLDTVVAGIRARGGAATAVVTDTTREADVARLFETAEGEGGGVLDLVVYNAGNNFPKPLLETEAEFFEMVWRVGCLGGFLVGREAGRRMIPRGRGTLLFTGATASIKGRPPFGSFAAAKAGLRSLAQTMARDWGPQGIHVAHVIIDGGINGDVLNTRYPQFKEQRGEDGLLGVEAIADTYWHLHTQHKTAWAQEIDLRPYKETF